MSITCGGSDPANVRTAALDRPGTDEGLKSHSNPPPLPRLQGWKFPRRTGLCRPDQDNARQPRARRGAAGKGHRHRHGRARRHLRQPRVLPTAAGPRSGPSAAIRSQAPQLQTAHSASITATGALSSKAGTAGSSRKEKGARIMPHHCRGAISAQACMRSKVSRMRRSLRGMSAYSKRSV